MDTKTDKETSGQNTKAFVILCATRLYSILLVKTRTMLLHLMPLTYLKSWHQSLFIPTNLQKSHILEMGAQAVTGHTRPCSAMRSCDHSCMTSLQDSVDRQDMVVAWRDWVCFLLWICGVTKFDRITNKGLRETTKVEEISRKDLERRWSWSCDVSVQRV